MNHRLALTTTLAAFALACLVFGPALAAADACRTPMEDLMALGQDVLPMSEVIPSPFHQEPAEPQPRGLTCNYTCDGNPSQGWVLQCSLSTERACCDLADTICPRVEPGSTATASCSC